MKREQRNLEIWSARLEELFYEKYCRIFRLSAVFGMGNWRAPIHGRANIGNKRLS